METNFKALIESLRAAYKLPDGKIIAGHFHADALSSALSSGRLDYMLSMPYAELQLAGHDVYAEFDRALYAMQQVTGKKAVDGFVTPSGKFMNRKEALEYALHRGLAHDSAADSDWLDAADLL